MISVLVANPGRQHSDQLALALQERSLLGLYVHGSPARKGISDRINASLDCEWLSYRFALAAIDRFAPTGTSANLAHAAYRHFDRRVERLVRKGGFQAVVGYENSALSTFASARKLGILTILDAASVHYNWQQSSLAPHELKSRNARKAGEVDLSDYIITCSSMARESYLEAGVAAERCLVGGFGVDLSLFSPIARAKDMRPFRFVFVGRISEEKGADTLVEACTLLKDEGVAFTLDCIGDGDARLAKFLGAFGTIHGKLPHARLPDLYRSSDCLVHPSRFDSFASVVGEALASGIPAIVSDRTGARDMIAGPATGVVVPAGDPVALAAAMREQVTRRDGKVERASACREAASAWSWESYRTRIAAIVETIVTNKAG